MNSQINLFSHWLGHSGALADGLASGAIAQEEGATVALATLEASLEAEGLESAEAYELIALYREAMSQGDKETIQKLGPIVAEAVRKDRQKIDRALFKIEWAKPRLQLFGSLQTLQSAVSATLFIPPAGATSGPQSMWAPMGEGSQCISTSEMGGYWYAVGESHKSFENTTKALDISSFVPEAREIASEIRRLVASYPLAKIEQSKALREADTANGGRLIQAGDEMEPSRPYQTGDEVSRIDWMATARSDKVFIKVFSRRTEQQQELILIDPRAFWFSPYLAPEQVYTKRKNVRNRYDIIETAATLAEIAFRFRKAVALIVGNSQIYLPPHRNRRDTTPFIAALLAYTKDATPPPLDLKSGSILFDERVRKHLKAGVVVHWVTPLPPEEIEETERAVAQYRSLGVELRLAKYQNTHDFPSIVANFAGSKRNFAWEVSHWGHALREDEIINRYTKLLKQTSGFIIDPYWDYYGRGEVSRKLLRELSKPVPKRDFHIFLHRGGRSQISVEENRDPHALRLIPQALDDLSGRSLALLVQTAKMRGWAMVLRYLREEKERLGQMYGRLIGFERFESFGWVSFEIPDEAAEDLLDFASHHAPNFSLGRVDPQARPWGQKTLAKTIDELSHHAARNLDGSPYSWLHEYGVKIFLERTSRDDSPQTIEDLRQEIEGHYALIDHFKGEPAETEQIYRAAYLSTFKAQENGWRIQDPFGDVLQPGPWITEWPFDLESSVMAIAWDDSWRNWIGFPMVRAWLHNLAKHPQRVRHRVEQRMAAAKSSYPYPIPFEAPLPKPAHRVATPTRSAAFWEFLNQPLTWKDFKLPSWVETMAGLSAAWQFLNKPRTLQRRQTPDKPTPSEIKSVTPVTPGEPVSEGKIEISGAIGSGVLTDEFPFDHWLTVFGVLPPLSQYFPRSFGINYHPQHAGYTPDQEFPISAFQIGGGKRIRGRLKPQAASFAELPTPQGAKLIEASENGLEYELPPNLPPYLGTWIHMPVPEFRARAPGIYGRDRYEQLVAGPVFNELGALTKKLWGSLLEGLEGMTVGESLERIKYAVRRKVVYGKLQDPVQKTLFLEFQRRAAQGKANGPDEYMDWISLFGRGVCMEQAWAEVRLARLAGIPAVETAGYLAFAFGVGGRHGWASIVFPDQGTTQWWALPLQEIGEVLGQLPQKKVETTKTDIQGAWQDLRILLMEQNPQQRAILGGMIELYTISKELAAKGDQRMADMLLAPWHRQAWLRSFASRPAPSFQRLIAQVMFLEQYLGESSVMDLAVFLRKALGIK